MPPNAAFHVSALAPWVLALGVKARKSHAQANAPLPQGRELAHRIARLSRSEAP